MGGLQRQDSLGDLPGVRTSIRSIRMVRPDAGEPDLKVRPSTQNA